MANTALTNEREAKASLSSSKKVGIIALVAFVVSAMLGGGVFNLPADAAAAASPGSLLVAWAITAVGIWFLANTFRILSDSFPDLKNGIFTYALHGFGRVIGFLSAFGYWVSNTCVLVVYSVLITQTLAVFFPSVFSDANGSFTFVDVGFSLMFVWVLFFVANKGVKQSAALNIAGTVGKLIPILLAIIILFLGFQWAVFVSAFWGISQQGIPLSFSWENLGSQISQTMITTLFLFTGIEGAVVISGQAKNQKDVARATVLGFLIVLALYMMVSLLPLGVYAQGVVAGMTNPSLSTIVGNAFPTWGSLVVNIGIIIAVMSTGLVKLNMLGEMPLFGARAGLFPQIFTRTNKNGAPSWAYACSILLASCLIVLVHFLSGNVWLDVINITNIMVLPGYFLSCLFLWKQAMHLKKEWWAKKAFSRAMALVTGTVGTIFSLYLFYASGFPFLLLACFLYIFGLPLLVRGQAEQRKADEAAGVTSSTKEAPFKKWEIAFMATIVVLGVIGVVYAVISGLFVA